MTEIQLNLIVFGNAETLESFDLCFPIPMLIAHDVSSLYNRINNITKNTNSRAKRYFVLLLESTGDDEDSLYKQMEENPQIISVFYLWNESFMPVFKITKLYYIPSDSITLALSLSVVQFLKAEADKELKSGQVPLAKVYLRKAEKTKEWVMSHLRVCLINKL